MTKTYPFTVTIAVTETRVYEYEVQAENDMAAAALARHEHWKGYNPEDGKSVWTEETVSDISCEDDDYCDEEEAEEA
ncbi:MAG: hypothetical protein ACK42H_19500 [Planctomycetota bacterium]|jgi:hypothetical protein